MLAIGLALAACSAIKLGYNTLTDVSYWWLDSYIDFNEQQAPAAKQELASLHAWHRREEVPKFADLLVRMQQLAPASISPQQACGVVTEVQSRLGFAAEHAEPAILKLAASLGPAQLRHIERKYRGNNEKFTREWIQPGPEEVREKRYEQMLDKLEMIYGSLDAPQRAVLRQGIAQSIYDPQRVLAERKRRQQDLLQTLRRMQEPGTTPDAARTALRGYLDRVQHSPDLAYRAWQDQLLQEGCRTFSAVQESTTTAQRQEAVRRLRGYERDLRELAGQAS
ncbi:DUF6279 family lipoprotein [Ramlibacter agri]|uniref:DUF6279 family lipoprotein n=1 Tax=Ramlibacter agri TaxID=2728837 RepID=UPI00315AA632